MQGIAENSTTGQRRKRESIADFWQPKVFNAESRRRFVRARRLALLAHLGRAPSCPALILIARIIRTEWDLRRLDSRLDAEGELSPYAMHLRMAAENRLRLDLVALGLRPPPAPAPDPYELIAALTKPRAPVDEEDEADAS